MQQALFDLIQLLDLEEIDVNLFKGVSPDEGWQRVYGGQVIGQALMAASRTVPDATRIAHSPHGYFLRPGDTTCPIIYQVDQIRDGRSFTTRRVKAIQKGEAIFSMSASFHVFETGLEHQVTAPTTREPEACVSERTLIEAYTANMPEAEAAIHQRSRPIDMRFVDPVDELNPKPMPAEQAVWIRAIDDMPDDPRLHQCLLAYASDMTLIDTSYRPHAINWHQDNFQVASLDHAMWFHRPFRTDEWLLYQQDSPFSGGARGFSRGTFFDAEGRLVASCAQEGLIRLHQ